MLVGKLSWKAGQPFTMLCEDLVMEQQLAAR